MEAEERRRDVVRDAFAREMERSEHRLAVIGETTMEDLEDAVRNQQNYQEAMEVLRARLQVVEDVTVPKLVSAHKLVLERDYADTAIQVRRRAAATMTDRE